MCYECDLNRTNELEYIQMHTSYMIEAFEDIEKMADIMRERFKRAQDHMNLDDPDTLIGTGLSGALVIPRLADIMGKRWAIVRKNDGSHSNNPVEGQIGHKWMFVDDLISSGNTLLRVKKVIREIAINWDFPTEYVGTYEYHYKRFRKDF